MNCTKCNSNVFFSQTVKHESSPPKKDSKSQHRLSKNTHELLSEIFKKIGLKDQTKEVRKWMDEWL